MCGLWGAVGTHLLTWHVDMVQDLAAFSVPRGKDSTGITCIKKDTKQPQSLKQTCNPVTFFDIGNVKELINQTPFCAVMGHNRLATVGAINTANAHPFSEGKLVGMHNGTIEAFKPKYKDQDRLTDSRMLYKHIDQHGLQSAINKAGHAGAMALTYYNKEDETLNFYRNGHRPLHCMVATSGTFMVWASEKATLEYLKERESISFGDVRSFETNKHYTIELFKETLSLEVEDMKYPSSGTVYYGAPGPIKPEHLKAVEDKKKEAPRPTTGLKQVLKSTTQRVLGKDTTGQTTSPAGEEKPTTMVLSGLPGSNTSVPQVYTRAIQKGDWYAGYNNECWDIPSTTKKLQDETCMLCTKKPTIFDPVWWMAHDQYVCISCVALAREQTKDLHQGSIKRGH